MAIGLVLLRVLTPFEARQIKRNEELLSLIRARLHVISNRREDRLVFDLQTAVAESFGYQYAWLGASAFGLIACTAVLIGRSMLLRVL